MAIADRVWQLRAERRALITFVRCIADDDASPWQGDATEILLDCGAERSGENFGDNYDIVLSENVQP